MMINHSNVLFHVSRMDTLKRHLPFSGQEGLQELKKIAVRFEEKIYTSATSQVYPSFGHLLFHMMYYFRVLLDG